MIVQRSESRLSQSSDTDGVMAQTRASERRTRAPGAVGGCRYFLLPASGVFADSSLRALFKAAAAGGQRLIQFLRVTFSWTARSGFCSKRGLRDTCLCWNVVFMDVFGTFSAVSEKECGRPSVAFSWTGRTASPKRWVPK